LNERRVDDGTVFQAFDRHHHDSLVGKTDNVAHTGQGDAAQHHFPDLKLGRNDDVNRHVIAGKQILIVRLQIGLCADAGDLGRHIEQSMRHFTGDDVHLVIKRCRNDHVRLLGTGGRQNIRVGAVTDKTAHIQRVAYDLNELGRRVDDRNIIVFGSQAFGDAISNLPCAADDHTHQLALPSAITAIASTSMRLLAGGPCGLTARNIPHSHDEGPMPQGKGRRLSRKSRRVATEYCRLPSYSSEVPEIA
jgi:hypothetical protein